MKPRIKQRWLKALRSDNYRQGKGQLHNSALGTFCCLGVLCDLYPKADWEGNSMLDDTIGLPKIVQKWAGLTSSNPPAGAYPLAWWNDEGKSFNDIADLIEVNL